VEVSVLGTRYNLGKRVPTRLEGRRPTTWTNRIAGLQPGTYYVMASSTETWRTEKKESLGYASTYFPGGPIDLAQLVTLAPSQQRTDLDFSLHASRTGRIIGRVQTEAGQPVAAPGVSLAYSFPGVILTFGMRTVRGGPDGSFEIKDVAPGVYAVMSGSDEHIVTMTGADVEDLRLVSKSGSTVSGTLVTDEDARPPFQPSAVRVSLQAPDGKVLPTVRLVSLEPDWSFKLAQLGGPFLFRLIGLPQGWTLGAVRLDDKDITDAPWDVPTGGRQIGGLKIVVTQKVGRVAGGVVDESNQPTSNATLVVFAEDETLWIPGSRFVRTTRPDRDGRFSIAGLPAGTYRAIARAYIEDGQWEDPKFLEEARDTAVKFILGEGGAQTLTLKLPSVR
jgi:hypothetical protein